MPSKTTVTRRLLVANANTSALQCIRTNHSGRSATAWPASLSGLQLGGTRILRALLQ